MQLESRPVSTDVSWEGLSTFRSVPNQGPCGSCWAIASSTVLQANAEIHTQKLRTFSAQQLVSCVPNPRECGGQGGCSGATVELAYEWVMNNSLATDSEVPYWANETACTAPATVALTAAKSPSSAATTAFGMTGWTRLPKNKYRPLLLALVEYGPVAVSAAGRAWALYEKGIFDGCKPDIVIDHAVVLIAFGTVVDKEANTTKKFWKVQNSWGSTWGENGTIRMLRTDDEDKYCGVNDHPELGTGCKGGPDKVDVCGMCGILFDSVVPFF